ncbi:hypothetical protein RB213_004244 [Colletotrichum asianum]
MELGPFQTPTPTRLRSLAVSYVANDVQYQGPKQSERLGSELFTTTKSSGTYRDAGSRTQN